MPEWLLRKDDYEVPKDKKALLSLNKDVFIDKSILSIIEILSKFRIKSIDMKDKYKLNPLTKLIALITFVLFVSLTKSFTYVLISNVVLLVIINFLSINHIQRVIKVSFGVMLFTLIIFSPSYIFFHNKNAVFVFLKVLSCVIAVNTVSASTSWNGIIRALKAFHISDLFIFVIDIAIKYIIMLGELSLEMLYALRVRSVGSSYHKSKSTSLSGIIGTIFIKSKDISDEMYGAMECRGFTGDYVIYYDLKFKLRDYVFIVCDIFFIILYFYFDRL